MKAENATEQPKPYCLVTFDDEFTAMILSSYLSLFKFEKVEVIDMVCAIII